MTRVSIIIPCYNQGKYVQDAINSALNQTYSDIEIVIVNDCSTDNSSEIIKQFADKYSNITFIDSQENHGVVYSRNLAIENAKGEYILPLDADDTIESAYVEKAVKILDEHPEIGIVYCNYRIFGDKEEYIKIPNFSKKFLLFGSNISPASMFRKEDFEKVGKYDERFNKLGCEDWDLWLSFYENDYKFFYIDEYLINYRKHNIQEARTGIQLKNKYEIYRNFVLKHKKLYLQDDEIIDDFFKGYELIDNLKQYIKNRKKKYKFIIILLSFIAVIELVLLVLLGVKII